MSFVFQDRFTAAAAIAARRLTELFPEAKEFSAPSYPRAWEIALEINGATVAAEIRLPEKFPSSLPEIRVKPVSNFRFVIPHVNGNGSLCLTTNAATTPVGAPEAAIDFVVARARAILESPVEGDFDAEFFSYWQTALEDVLVLTPDAEIPKQAFCFSDSAHKILAADETRLRAWCNRAGKNEAAIRSIGRVERIDLSARLSPSAFPRTVGDLLALIEPISGQHAEAIHEHLSWGNGSFLVTLRMPIVTGHIDAAVSFTAHAAGKSKDVTRGFRRGQVPWDVVKARASAQTVDVPVYRHAVQSVHAQHIRTRGGNGVDFSTKRVAVVGCGSLGGYVAHMLARMGVGSLLLVDNDTLSWDNAGRHVLGGLQVGKKKAEALRVLLQMESPHLEIEKLDFDLQQIVSTSPSRLQSVDLIVSTIGAWSVDYDLNYWARRATGAPPVIFAWIEPHGIAGHAMLVHPIEGGCLACGCNQWGEFKLSVTDPEATTQIQGRGCSGFFQPYGVAEMMPTAAMTVRLVADVLIGRCAQSEVRTFLGPRDEFETHGLSPRAPWDQILNLSPHGTFHSQPWPVTHECLIGR
ncbi:MAG TPA: ThiF family adenylyltransferase [Lacipirellulaceae bacterium]|nr:ThiF family adenylyltransferase [Lacipirellulaceae bacterium]HMP06456.1 ThiF family adenylyltransferase [Lacipirellulaceae bacterium]